MKFLNWHAIRYATNVDMEFLNNNYYVMKSLFVAFIGSILLFTSANAKNNFPVAATTNPLHSIRVTDAGGYLTNGTLDVIRFVSNNGSLWAVCKLRGIVDDIEIEEDCICPITVDPCDDIPPRLDLNATAAVVQMSNTQIAGDSWDVMPRRFDMFDLNTSAVGKKSNTQEAQPVHGCCVEIRFGRCTIRRVTGLVLDLIPHKVQCTVRDFPEDLLCNIHNTPRILTGQLAALLNLLL